MVHLDDVEIFSIWNLLVGRLFGGEMLPVLFIHGFHSLGGPQTGALMLRW